MTKIQFFIILIILITVLVNVNKILVGKYKFKENILNYISLTIVLVYLVIGAFMTFSETKQEFKELSNTFEGQNTANKRPHRWWDIDTYW